MEFCGWMKKDMEGLDHKNLRVTTVKYLSGHRKHRYGLVDEPKKQPKRTFICNELATKVIMGCRTTATHKFRTRLRFKQYVILIKEQSVLMKIKNSLKMQTQYSVLRFRTDYTFMTINLQ